MRRKHFLYWLVALQFTLQATDLQAMDAMVLSPTTQFAINSITVQDTNLLFSAAIPASITQVTLEMRTALDTAWQNAGIIEVAPGEGEVAFTIPKPTNDICFFRLEATNVVENSTEVSSELRYVTMPSLAANLDRDGNAVFHFKGLVDGSDKILITRDGALWSHVNWDWPQGPVNINGTQWNPEDKNYLTTVGNTRFLPATFSLETASLVVTEGRDVVALERTNNGLIVYLDDTPAGASEYEFALRFHPAIVQPNQPDRMDPVVVTHLDIAADIDGSDCLEITPTQATWEHGSWACPTAVTLNNVVWFPLQTNILANEGTNAFLPAGVDLSTARIVRRTGRDLATMWADKDALRVWFADNPNGSDHYELEISFGP